MAPQNKYSASGEYLPTKQESAALKTAKRLESEKPPVFRIVRSNAEGYPFSGPKDEGVALLQAAFNCDKASVDAVIYQLLNLCPAHSDEGDILLNNHVSFIASLEPRNSRELTFTVSMCAVNQAGFMCSQMLASRPELEEFEILLRLQTQIFNTQSRQSENFDKMRARNETLSIEQPRWISPRPNGSPRNPRLLEQRPRNKEKQRLLTHEDLSK